MANFMRATAVFLFSVSSVLGRAMFYFLLDWTLLGFLAALFVGSLMVFCLGMAAIYLFLSSQRVSEHHTVFSALFHFIITYYVTHIGKTNLSQFRKSFPNPRQTQEIRLKEILTRNKDTAYGVEFKLGEINGLRDFKKKHPLTTYDHYEPFVQRVAKGEKKVMTNEPITRLVLTSGTTGKGKIIPRHKKELTNYLGTVSAIYLECFPQVHLMQKIFRLHCNTKLVNSEGGIPIAAGMVVERDTARFMPMFSTPPDGFMIESINEAFYVHFLFALRERRLGSAMAVFSSMFVEAFKFFEEHWPEIVNDLANGTINKNLNLPFNIRESLENSIGSGDVQRAEDVRRECEKGQQGIMKRLWPLMECVAVADNLGIKGTLMKTIGEGLHFHAPFYAASEALIGMNFNPLNKACDEVVMAVTDTIFEFIPENNIYQSEPETYLIDEVEVGKNYEVVVSQLWGLYRYRFGDVVQVTGYYENTPKVKFLYRTATVLNLFGEKVDQPILLSSLRTALSHWPEVEMTHYSVAESTMLAGMPEYNDNNSRGAHYVLFLEMKPAEKESSSLHVDTAALAKEIDDNIYKSLSFFRKFKDSKQIHGSEVHLVKPGSFNELKQFILSNTSATEVQFKMPQKLRTKEMAKIMLLNRIQ